MTDKFTPGPWKITECLDLWIESVAKDEDGETVAIAHCGDIRWRNYETKQQEWEANARLIRAAPDMLAALDLCEKLIDDETDDDWLPVDAVLKIVREAIAEARGEEVAT